MSGKTGMQWLTPYAVAQRTLLAKTCYKCHKFCQAECFRRMKNGFWQSQCTSCLLIQINRIQKRANAESRDTAYRHGEPWTNTEINLLLSMTNEGLSHKEMAKRLSRTISSVTTAKKIYLTKEN